VRVAVECAGARLCQHFKADCAVARRSSGPSFRKCGSRDPRQVLIVDVGLVLITSDRRVAKCAPPSPCLHRRASGVRRGRAVAAARRATGEHMGITAISLAPAEHVPGLQPLGRPTGGGHRLRTRYREDIDHPPLGPLAGCALHAGPSAAWTQTASAVRRALDQELLQPVAEVTVGLEWLSAPQSTLPKRVGSFLGASALGDRWRSSRSPALNRGGAVLDGGSSSTRYSSANF